MSYDYDVIVIGGGPAGMTASLYLKRANIKFLLLEGNVPGGQMNRSFVIENYPGIKSISGPDLANEMFDNLLDLKIDFKNEEVLELIKNNDSVVVKTKNNEYKSKYVIIATGRSPRKITAINADKFEGRGISYCALCDGMLYRNKNVIVVGGGNSAIEEALYLASIARKVTIVHHNKNIKADELMVSRIKQLDNVDFIYDVTIKEFVGDNYIEKVILSDDKEIIADGVFVCIGYLPNTSSFKILEMEDNYIKINSSFETSISKVYAIGDVVKKDTYQVVTACGDAANVVNRIIRDIQKKS